MSTRWIINADDYGLAPGVNRGILELAREGVVTATSVMIDFPGVEEALRKAKAVPPLELGLHVDLTSQRSLTQTVLRVLAGRLSRQELTDEIHRQIRLCHQYGFEPRHLNSHHHIHLLPRLFPLFVDAAKQWGIPHVRFEGRPQFIGENWRQRLLHLAALPRRKSSAPSALYFFSPDAPKSVDTIAPLCPNATRIEVICHPGYADDTLRTRDSYVEAREKEMVALRRFAQNLPEGISPGIVSDHLSS